MIFFIMFNSAFLLIIVSDLLLVLIILPFNGKSPILSCNLGFYPNKLLNKAFALSPSDTIKLFTYVLEICRLLAGICLG